MTELEALYARVPALSCRGMCALSCGPIPIGRLERERVEALAGRRLKVIGLTCSILRKNRCSGYAARPLICRLWGIVESMRCPYGCRPDRFLSDAEGFRLLDELAEIEAGR